MRYTFGDFEVDLQLFELRRAGQRVRVEPKVFDLLVYLLEHRGRVVTKTELLDTVWGSEHVVEAVLPTAIRRLRSVLGQGSEENDPIATERGRGYRFTMPVQRSAGASAPLGGSSLFPRERGTDLLALRDEEPLVGRTLAVSDLLRMLERGARQRKRPRMRMLTGLPGVGRTRMLSEIVELARARGVQCVSARGQVGSPDLWPWSSIVRQLLESLGEAVTTRVPRPLQRELSGFAPVLRTGDTVPPPSPVVRPPVVVADSLRSLLQIVSPDATVLIALDDLDHFDAGSLGVLQILAEGEARRPLLIATVCEPMASGSEVAKLIHTLERGEHVVREVLAPLTVSETRAYVQAATGTELAAEVAEHVHEVTAGLPAVLRACVRAWPSTRLGSLAEVRELAMPATARDPARRRFASLGPESVSALRIAAVLGVSFDLVLLRTLAALDAGRALSIVEQAVELGVLAPDEAQAHSYRFTLGYLRDTLYDELKPSERRQLHHAAAQALERRAEQSKSEPDVRLLAHHMCSALPSAPVAKAVRYSVRAAQLSVKSAEYKEAVGHYTRAISALSYATQMDSVTNAELLLELATAQGLAGDSEAARASLEQVLAIPAHSEQADELHARAKAALDAS